MHEDVSWDEYNAHQQGRAPRPLLLRALELRGSTPAGGGREAHEPPVAVDLGCGEGVEVEALLARGWVVHAVDGEAAALDRLTSRVDDDASRLHVHHRAFAEAQVPPADLVHSSYALPYCAPDDFGPLWERVRRGLRPGGILAVQLFGDRDDMAGTPGMTFHSLPEATELLDGLDVLHWQEEDGPGTSFTGPKHWHVFHVIARQPTG